MIKAEQIPDEVVEAAAKAAYEEYMASRAGRHRMTEAWTAWSAADNEVKPRWRNEARAAIAAALAAWPGAQPQMIINGQPVNIILPLQETADGK